MAKYVVMIETDKMPDPGNCDNCEFNCPYHMSYWDKQMIWEMDPTIRLHHLSDFYCPIRVVVDLETFMKWKEEHPDFGEPKQLEVKHDT